MNRWILEAGMILLFTSCTDTEVTYNKTDFNGNWLFSLEQSCDAFGLDVDDSQWRSLDLPHDWSVEFPFDSVNGEGCTAYLPGGTGWYRKHFQLAAGEDEKVFILFDGVYNHSECWINGVKLGEHPYGYSPFWYDLTPHLDPEGQNVLAVKVDRTRYADSRWYSGSGIYRNVKLIRSKKLHIPVWGVFVTTPEVSKAAAIVKLEISVKNEFNLDRKFSILTEIHGPDGSLRGEARSELSLAAGEDILHNLDIEISEPLFWDVETPHLYSVHTRIVQDDKVLDAEYTTFGIRSFNFDPEKGFSLNGKSMKIKGVCLHHDGGLVGTAVPRGVWERRLEILREGGCNAIRLSHNPASEEFLDICDEMGFLVQDEFFDEWDYPKDKRLNMYERHDDYISRGYAEYFQEHAESDLKSTILAHRNHPSVIQWSIGNEIEWTYPRNRSATGFFDNMDWSGNYFWSQPPYSPEKIREIYNSFPSQEYNIGSTAEKLARWTREMDTTRPVIANCILPSVSFETGYADALDIVGFSYRRVMYDYAKEHYPHKVVMGTENLGQWHEWKAIEERDFVSGTFLWTGIDYLGESNAQWPSKATNSGLLDLAGFPKPSWHMYRTLWQDEPHIYVSSNRADQSNYILDRDGKVVEKQEGAWEHALWTWHDVNEHWNYQEGDAIIVEVISNCSRVELFLNGESLGMKKLEDFPDRILKWMVPYAEGLLEARGSKDGLEVEASIATAGESVALELIVDKDVLGSNERDVAHAVVQLVDARGNPVKHLEKRVEFEIEGPVRMLGVDNGWSRSTQSYQATSLNTRLGRALCIIQSSGKPGTARLTVKSEGLEAASVELSVN